ASALVPPPSTPTRLRPRLCGPIALVAVCSVVVHTRFAARVAAVAHRIRCGRTANTAERNGARQPGHTHVGVVCMAITRGCLCQSDCVPVGLAAIRRPPGGAERIE